MEGERRHDEWPTQGGWLILRGDLTPEGALPFSRFVREGGDFDSRAPVSGGWEPRTYRSWGAWVILFALWKGLGKAAKSQSPESYSAKGNLDRKFLSWCEHIRSEITLVFFRYCRSLRDCFTFRVLIRSCGRGVQKTTNYLLRVRTQPGVHRLIRVISERTSESALGEP